jgi:glycosidase
MGNHHLDLVRKQNISLNRLMPRLEARFAEQASTESEAWEIFVARLRNNYPRLFRLYYHLYSSRYDFFYYLEDLLDTLARMWFERPSDLKALDARRETDPLWFQSAEMLGGVCYVDLFAGDLTGIHKAIPYFKELGLTYLHLMPLFRVPEGENDGGYAVSSYREVNPALGSMQELVALAAELRGQGISLVLDLVFNHTSDEHIWAQRALEGDPEFQEYYRMFPDRRIPNAYEAHLREIFPDERPGSFTYRSEIDRWVWTTFHSYQWDLNYANPEVFNRMVEEMLLLANAGVEVLRLDAVAFIWKEMGTDCENLPEAHMLIQAFNAAALIAAPATLFKSEAIVHPDEVVKYISPDECQLSYNPLLMALLWNSLATRKVDILNLALRERFSLKPKCSWVNYVRSHDDIGWTFSDEDAQRLGMNAYDHRRFLNDFYTGRFEGSFARGLPFQENPRTGDARISGTCASLAGLEKALNEEGSAEVDLAIRRILLIHAVIMTVGGIPLIYLGDEVGMMNDYLYSQDSTKSGDSRWVHRPLADWVRIERRGDPERIEGRIFMGLRQLIKLRKEHPALAGNDLHVIDTANPHVLGYIRPADDERLMIFANFSERTQVVSGNQLRLYGIGYEFYDLINNKRIAAEELSLQPYDFICLIA